jgi:quercetin dioxygenase-like cupin family protein
MNRVVTGYDQDGNPAIIRQGEPPAIIRAGRYTTTELWVSERGPIKATDEDTSTREWALEPPPGGACFRIVEIAPGADGAGNDVSSGQEGSLDTHATDTLDFVTILRGEVTLLVGGDEVTLRPGDSAVQQPGVLHDWQNRTAEWAAMVGILASAK